MKNPEETLIENLWRLFSEQKWEESKKLFHADFTAEWPQSKERFVGAENFVNMQQAYPGNHTIELLQILSNGHRVVTAVYVHADTGQKAYANSYFEIKDGKIWRLTEFWGAPYEAPEDRKKFTEA
jgi:hypothetical protein